MKCKECGADFEHPEVYNERHGFIDGPYEKFYFCPECGSEDLRYEN